MEYRESKENNNLFYLCSLVECIARITKNEKCDVYNALGEETVKKIYEFADTYHCEDINDVANEFITKCNIKNGKYDCITGITFEVPGIFDLGKVYKRFIIETSREEKLTYLQAAKQIYNSRKICKKIEDFNSSLYYDNERNIYLFYKEIA